MSYNHEAEMERMYETYSAGIHSIHHTHNVGHISVIGHNPPGYEPSKPPLPTPPTPNPNPPDPDGNHHKHHKHKNKGFFQDGIFDMIFYDDYKTTGDVEAV